MQLGEGIVYGGIPSPGECFCGLKRMEERLFYGENGTPTIR
jgi:hypothetical protein